LVVDDHDGFRSALVSALELLDDIDVIGEADGGVAACGSAVELRPEAIVMDVSMADLSGIEAMQHIHRELPDVPVVFLTARGDDGVRRAAIDAGAAGFVVKGAALEEIVAAVYAALGMDVAPSEPGTARADEEPPRVLPIAG
jgi:DNA-binding NarL/FixJ family response regulator